MNSLRIRLVKLSELYGAGSDFPFAIQASQDGLCWWTIGRFKEFDPALAHAKELDQFIRKHMMLKEDKVLWRSKDV